MSYLFASGIFKWKRSVCLIFRNSPATVTTAPELEKRFSCPENEESHNDNELNSKANTNNTYRSKYSGESIFTISKTAFKFID
jgi:hypothetical protein